MNICTDPNALKIFAVILKTINVLKVVVLVVLIVVGMFGLAKGIISGNQEDIKLNFRLFIKKLIVGSIVFLLPTVLETGLVFFGDLAGESNFTDCIQNTNNIPYFEQLESQREPGQQQPSTPQPSTPVEESEYEGKKYDLTDQQLTQIAALCEQENYGAVGIEAELMSNLFELNGSKYGSGGAGLYNYLKNGGWFHSGSQLGNLTLRSNQSKEIVRKVLVEGKRTWPPYINEHDCIDCGAFGYDVVKIVLENGRVITDHQELLNKKNYVKDKTVIYNRYGSVYTFYGFPCDNCDPFGYTESAKKKYEQSR